MNLISNIDISSVDSYSPLAIYDFSNLIYRYFVKAEIENYENIIILCIGSDRSTGDSLGPLVGYKLEPILATYDNICVLGTLNKPVHAKNLEEKIDFIHTEYINPFVLAIDASLGRFDKVGYVNIKNGPLKPGLGVNKKLPDIGNISITGVVNISGMMEYVVLQNTRLGLVMNMADVISRSTHIALHKYIREKREKKSKF